MDDTNGRQQAPSETPTTSDGHQQEKPSLSAPNETLNPVHHANGGVVTTAPGSSLSEAPSESSKSSTTPMITASKPSFSISSGIGGSGRGLPMHRNQTKRMLPLMKSKPTPSPIAPADNGKTAPAASLPSSSDTAAAEKPAVTTTTTSPKSMLSMGKTKSRSLFPGGRKLLPMKQNSNSSSTEKPPPPPTTGHISLAPKKVAELPKKPEPKPPIDTPETATEPVRQPTPEAVAPPPPSTKPEAMDWSKDPTAETEKPETTKPSNHQQEIAPGSEDDAPTAQPPPPAMEEPDTSSEKQKVSDAPQNEPPAPPSAPSPPQDQASGPTAMDVDPPEQQLPPPEKPSFRAPLDNSTQPTDGHVRAPLESPSQPVRPESQQEQIGPAGDMMQLPPPPPPMGQPQAEGAPARRPPEPEQQPASNNYGLQQQQPLPPPPLRVPSPPPAPMMRELRVEDALLYLDDVKREFKDQPTIYNKFLAIMKNFKSQEVDTPGVISQVSKLFRGYKDLILGFNTFLPEGNKISAADLDRMEAENAREEMEAAAGKATGEPGRGQNQRGQDGSPPNQRSRAFAQQQQPPAAAAPVQQGQQHQAVEFDHAISYVTTIKKRFANDPSTYHQFLEILHTYQREQRGIKEVLEQVAHLFQDHPDLLKEFNFFLPDAVQEQAKARLNQAAEESEIRIAAQRQQQEMGRYGKAAQKHQHNQQQFVDDLTRTGKVGFSDDLRGRKRNKDGYQMPVDQPDLCAYNSAVERQFFDSARDALSSYPRDGGQGWAEFKKVLHMYSQEILARGDMLALLEPLLGKRNDLFEEFKRILVAAGSPSSATKVMEDSWHSVPLAEIDFSRCRRCSPSYRALPRDYPAHPCSDRSIQDAAVLNDVWVSLPVGSEESYTFRHMRRNSCEEHLFRVEDERFEIDMVIDSNRTTIQRLEPIVEEIAALAKEDFIPLDLGIKPPMESGMGGKKFQYIFDKSLLGVIHRNAITRIYGPESGREMMELMAKNPTVAVPLVLDRLREKDKDWKAVRERLNRQWKEIAEANYHKSMDHRSLTWRTIDKRAISTRTLVTEIKDRAANGGKEGKCILRQRLDKLKEEHGAFYEKTVGEKLTQDVDLTFFPKPDRRLFTPHMALVYDNVSWAQRDAYRILAFALERGPISPADKERCHRLWVEFLGPWFDLSLNWMQKPAVTYQESAGSTFGDVRTRVASVVSEDDEESLDGEGETGEVDNMETDDGPADQKEYMDHHPLPAGAHVSTLYGEGKVIEFRRSEHIYAVQLRFGAVGYLRPATVLCSMLPVEKSAYTRQLRADDRTKLQRPNDQLSFGTQSLYLFFRLHQILIDRLNTAKRLAFSVGNDPSLQTMVEQMPSTNRNAVGRRRYEAYISLVYALLDGSVDPGKYEDRVRSLLGHAAYELATMDKLISHIWKDIQTMANDEAMWNLVQLYRRHLLAGSFQPEAFRQEAAYLSEGEPMYAFQLCPLVGSDQSVLYIEHVGVMEDMEEDEGSPLVEDELEEPANKRAKRSS